MPDNYGHKRLSKPAAGSKATYASEERRLYQYLNAAEQHQKTHQYKEQLRSLISAHSIYRELIASGEQSIIESISETQLLREMASTYEHLSNYQEQIKCLQEALKISEFDPKREISELDRMSNIVDISRKLRDAYGKVNDYTNQAIFRKKALESQKKVLEKAQSIFGDGVKVAKELVTLGALFAEQMDYHKQIELLFESLRIMLEKSPENHMVGGIYSSLSIAYREIGARDQQKEYLNLAFKAYKKILGEEHALTKKAQKNLGAAYEYEIVKFFNGLRLDASLLLEEIMEKVEMLIEKILNLLPEQRTLKSEWLLEYLLQYQEESMPHINFFRLAPGSNPHHDAGVADPGGVDDGGEPCCCYGNPPFVTGQSNSSDFIAHPV